MERKPIGTLGGTVVRQFSCRICIASGLFAEVLRSFEALTRQFGVALDRVMEDDGEWHSHIH
jgi:hypothetical protein